MIQKTVLPGALFCAVAFASCGAAKQLESAQAQIQQLQTTNNQLNDNIASMKKEATDALASFNNYRKECQENEEELAAVQAVLTEEVANLQKLEDTLEAALADFADKGVDVYYKNGLVYVSLADELLYKSGSATLGEDGKKALGSLAAALNDYPKLKVVVVGNTDDQQFKKGGDNLSLSTERANGVVRLLRDTYKVDPMRLTAAGKGKYNPVADNSTAEGRAKNRRTDIILNPDIDRLWDTVRRE